MIGAMISHILALTLLGASLLLAGCKGPGNIGTDDDRAQPPGGDDVENCTPLTCASAGKNCGTVADGCGGSLECGTCASGATCGAGGSANVCGVGTCTPTTCEAAGKNCGVISDGCSALLECGGCTRPEFCGGGGVQNVCGQDALATQAGCGGVFNPDQVLELHLTMAPADWSALKADTTNSLFFMADFRCAGEAALPFKVGVRRKRSGSDVKPGLKVDFNKFQPGGDWKSLKKISLENGISEGGTTASTTDLVAEYLSWRLMGLSGAYSSRAAFTRLYVNGNLVGTYTNVEQVDKRFLRSRLGDSSGWLYKHSGSSGDGYKTNTTEPNPYAQAMCFWERKGCPAPGASELETYLPRHLDIDQMLRLGGVNTLIGNTDAPLAKQNNYYWYDWAGGGRVYFPWDLDTVMRSSVSFFSPATGVGGGTTMYTNVLFTHWKDDYDVLMTGLLQGALRLSVIHAELDRVERVAGAALDSDPATSGSAASAVLGLKTWWTHRHAEAMAELESHAP
jgi:hypothetical protein